MASANGTISVTFRGVRGSYPMPGPSTLRYGGNTACHEIRAGGRLIIFDAGTGIISLGDELAQADAARTFALFISHNHHDHIGGLLYFKPAYMKSTTLHIYGPSNNPDGNILDTLENISSPTAHPVQFSAMGMRSVTEVVDSGDVVLWAEGDEEPHVMKPGESIGEGDVAVRIMKNRLHPLDGVLNFRLEYRGKSYVYATDVEGDEENGDPYLAEFARGADVLAHDGQYTSEEYAGGRKGWGHSTVGMAIATAHMAGVKKLVVIHHDPAHDDEQLDGMLREARAMREDVVFAREGDTITI